MVASVTPPAVPPARPPVVLRDIAIIGGGCYGGFYLGQLARARGRGAATFRRVLVVDRNADCPAAAQVAGIPGAELVVAEWGRFLDGFLAEDHAREGDAIVPSPLMPHLLVDWLARRARARWPGRPVRQVPTGLAAGTPWEREAPDGTRYLSHADWTCPVHCIEPPTCPMTRAPRTWEMGETLAALVRRLARHRRVAGPALLVTRHRTHGVGMFDVAEALAADRLVAEAGAAPDSAVLVGTISACHGAATLLELAGHPSPPAYIGHR